jgi:hypothetical protein
VLSGSVRSGRLGLEGESGIYQLRVRAEAYTRVSEQPTTSTRLVLSVGVSHGRFLHVMALPPDPTYSPGDVASGPPRLSMFRRETRIELIIGLQKRTDRKSFMISLAPFVISPHGAPESGTSGWAVDDLSVSAGVALLVSMGVGKDLLGRDPVWTEGSR